MEPAIIFGIEESIFVFSDLDGGGRVEPVANEHAFKAAAAFFPGIFKGGVYFGDTGFVKLFLFDKL